MFQFRAFKQCVIAATIAALGIVSLGLPVPGKKQDLPAGAAGTPYVADASNRANGAVFGNTPDNRSDVAITC